MIGPMFLCEGLGMRERAVFSIGIGPHDERARLLLHREDEDTQGRRRKCDMSMIKTVCAGLLTWIYMAVFTGGRPKRR